MPPRVGVAAPKNVLDLSPVFRRLTNGLTRRRAKDCWALCATSDSTQSARKRKTTRAMRILQGWPFTAAERKWILRLLPQRR